MMENGDMKERRLCEAMQPLFEKQVAGDPLSGEEARMLADHLEGCPSCGELHRIASGLGRFADAREDGMYDRAVFEVMDKLAQERRSTRFRWAAAVGAAAAALVVGVWVLATGQTSFSSPTPALCQSSSPVEVVPGVRMTHCDGAEPGTLIEDGAVRISLKDGAVALSVDPGRPDKKMVSVVTPEGEVRVKGTVFAVRVKDERASVEVFRGVVEVIQGSGDDGLLEVPAGKSARLRSRTLRSLPSVVADPLVLALGTSSIEVPDAPVAVSPDVVDEPLPVEERAAEETGDARGKTVHRGRNMHADAGSVDGIIENARSCLLSHDWECAAQQYGLVLKNHSRHPQSTAVLISLAKIELRHLNRPDQALSHYRAYLQQAPQGPLAEEALLGTADACRQLGRRAEETTALRRFVETYPDSSLRNKARLRLQQLDTSSL